MLTKAILLLVTVAVVSCQEPCHTTPHPTYGLGYCIDTSQCPNSLYISNLCPSYGNSIKCCYSGNLNCAYATYFTHTLAAAIIAREGITISSSGGCSDRNKPTCTSLEQIRCRSLAGLKKFKDRTKCAVRITGGTETGHSTSGTQTHWNGYKLDISLSSCYDNIIKGYKYLGIRGDGAPMYEDPDSTVKATYALEGNHWDIVYP